MLPGAGPRCVTIEAAVRFAFQTAHVDVLMIAVSAIPRTMKAKARGLRRDPGAVVMSTG